MAELRPRAQSRSASARLLRSHSVRKYVPMAFQHVKGISQSLDILFEYVMLRLCSHSPPAHEDGASNVGTRPCEALLTHSASLRRVIRLLWHDTRAYMSYEHMYSVHAVF